jgi:hypothetical protein
VTGLAKRFAQGLVAACLVGLALLTPALPVAAADVQIDDLVKAVTEDSNYKIRVQAALVLGRLADPRATRALLKALADPNKTVRGIAAQALGQIGDTIAIDPLRDLLRHEGDPFVRTQAEKALAGLSSPLGAGKRAKIYLSFGPFSGGVKSAGPEAAKLIQDALGKELGKLSFVTLSISPADQHNFAKTGMQGFFIDGNITRLDDASGPSGPETNCDVKVMIARWPSKSIVSWTNAGATVQSGGRPRDKENARRECLDAAAVQLAEDMGRFFKLQGG